MFENWKRMLENRKGFSNLEKNGCFNTRNLVILFKKCAKVGSHIACQKRAARTHIARTVPKTFPHALPHAHRTCRSAIIRTCAPQPNIWLSTNSVGYFFQHKKALKPSLPPNVKDFVELCLDLVVFNFKPSKQNNLYPIPIIISGKTWKKEFRIFFSTL